MNRRWICTAAGALLLAGGIGAAGAQAATGHGAAGAQQAARIRDEGPLPETTALQVTAPGPPRFVYGSDGRTHVDYDLVITNTFTAGATLRSLTVTQRRDHAAEAHRRRARRAHARDLSRAAVGPHPGVGD